MKPFYVVCAEMLYAGQLFPHNSKKETTRHHNKLKKGDITARTPNNTPTFHFNRRGTWIQTISVQNPKY
jgi:hypothetical protein